MTDVIELSSSDDEENKINSDSDKTDITDIANIINKYKSVNKDIINQPSKKVTISSSDDDDDEFNLAKLRSLREKLDLKYNLPSCINTANVFSDEESKNNTETLSQTTSSESNENLAPSKPKKKRSANTEEKSLQKLEKEQEKARKQAERLQKKAEAATAKAQKQALASAYKNLKPEECIKSIIAFIDSELMSVECGNDIPNCLQTANVNYKIKSNIRPFSVMWKMNAQTQLTNFDGQLKLATNEDHCDHILLITMWSEFVQLVHQNNLTEHFKTLKTMLTNEKIYLGIYGIENYFRAHKSKKQKASGSEKIYLVAPKISRKDVDMSLIEMQLLYGISPRFLETPQDVSAMILQFTKSIAQIPYKLRKEEKEKQMDWFVSGDNKDSVKVDKNGNGLYRLWQQQLTQLTLARLETAEAVCSNYPSPTSLMKAYEECSTKEQGEKLLQDLPIRRAVGPLTSQRKIGPEFSRKMYTLFTSLDPSIQL